MVRQQSRQEAGLHVFGDEYDRQQGDALAGERAAANGRPGVAAQVAGNVDGDRTLGSGEMPLVLDRSMDQTIVTSEIVGSPRSAAALEIVGRRAWNELPDAETAGDQARVG